MGSTFATIRKFGQREIPFPPLWPSFTTARQRRSLLRLIAVGIEENLPLGPLLRAWAADNRSIRTRLNRLAGLLDEGIPLPNALEAVPRLLGEEDLLAIRFDSQSGTRTATLRQRLVALQSPPMLGIHRYWDTLIYVSVVVILLIACVTFLQIWIVPQLENIAADFSVDTPRILQRSIRVVQFCVKYWFLFVIFGAAMFGLFYSARPGRFIRHSLIGRLFFPLREGRAADVLQKLAITASAGRPMSGALSTLARYHFDPALRRKLLYVRNELEQGAEVWPSMKAVGLLSEPEERLLRTADQIGNRPWILEQLANLKSGRTVRRLQRLPQVVLPAIVILLGGLVLVQALTLFESLNAFLSPLL